MDYFKLMMYIFFVSSMFDVEELDRAPKYDGHTPDDVTRLLSL